MMNIGQFLTIKREAMKWSRQQIADSIGVTYQKVHSWETGKQSPKAEDLKQICKHYGFSLSELKSQFKDYEDIERHPDDQSSKSKFKDGDNVKIIYDVPQVTLPPEEVKYVLAPTDDQSVKSTQHAFPLDVLKSRLKLALQVTASIENDVAYRAYNTVLSWIAELEGKE
jgi:transcriptional regulator with XRE-family HTH domain